MDVEKKDAKVMGVICCDFLRSGIGTRPRCGDVIGGKRVIEWVVEKMLRVEGVGGVVVFVPADQMEISQGLRSLGFGGKAVHVRALVRRAESIEKRVAIGRAWGLRSWRGGAGQWTCFDEEYHPAGIGKVVEEFGAEHVLVVSSHAVMLDVELTGKLVQHHLNKNHEMRVTYTPSAPGLTGMMMRADIVREMGEKGVMPWQLLAYDPKLPAFDTLIRDACMQVDPALSKVPNRFCVDTERSFRMVEGLWGRTFASLAEMALAAGSSVAPGVMELRAEDFPREVELELTGKRLTNGPGSVPAVVREGRGELAGEVWEKWWGEQTVLDDLLVTVGGDGDPLLYGELKRVLRAVKKSGVMNVCVQTDLGSACGELFGAIEEGLVDVVSVTMYGGTRETYAQVGRCETNVFDRVMGNFGELAKVCGARGGVPLVVPRLLKVRETIPEMEAFFDGWIQQAGWAVIEGPTDRAAGVEFEAVVDMGPMKRKACRRIWERMVLRANGNGVACTEDMMDHLVIGSIGTQNLREMWNGEAMMGLRKKHAAGEWGAIVPCATCREWYRA